MTEHEKVQEGDAKGMLAKDVMLEIGTPNPESKLKEMKSESYGRRNRVLMDGEPYKQGCSVICYVVKEESTQTYELVPTSAKDGKKLLQSGSWTRWKLGRRIICPKFC